MLVPPQGTRLAADSTMLKQLNRMQRYTVSMLVPAEETSAALLVMLGARCSLHLLATIRTLKLFLGLYTTPTIPDAMVPPGFSDTVPYSVTFDGSQNTQACRIYHLSVASTLPDAHCVHGSVSGGDTCGKYVSNLCTLISQACGFGNNETYQFPNLTACTAGLNNIEVGSNQLKTGTDQSWASTSNTLECRFYHASVAASFAAGGANFATAGAAANQVLHCSHVLRKSAPGGCEGVVTPTPAATPTPALANSAFTSGLSLFAFTLAVYIS